jgi:hypothetical protein
MAAQPAAFMTYVRSDDQREGGQLTLLRERLAAEIRAQTGAEFTIFQDRNDIAWGQNWQQRIDEAVDAATILLVIVTPSLFRSPASRTEIVRFLERERMLDRDDLIVPVYYISTPELDDPVRFQSDDLAQAIASRQYVDWREFRFEPFTSPMMRAAIAQLATRIREILWTPLNVSGDPLEKTGTGPSISALEPPPPIVRPRRSAVFLSYAAAGNPPEDGAIAELSNHLAAEIELQTGERFPILRHPYDGSGRPLHDPETEGVLNAATLLIPVITPAFFKNDICRAELARFLGHERALGRDDLILPIYYTSTPEMSGSARHKGDELAQILTRRQYADWRRLKSEPWTSPVVREALAQLVGRMKNILSGRPSPAESSGAEPPSQGPLSPRPASAERNRVFVSYSHKDHKQLARLRTHLKPLERDGRLELWDDTRIQAGDKWRNEIREAIESCRVAILLISADFMASDFIQDNELPRILNEAQRRGVRIFSIIVGYSHFEDTALAQYEAVNSPSRPLLMLSVPERDAIFLKVYEIVKATLPGADAEKVRT